MALLLTSGGSATTRGAGEDRHPLAILGVGVVEVESGRLLPNRTVVVEAGRIVAAGPADETPVPPDSRVVEADGQYLIPGLWDARVHVFATPEEAAAVLPLFLVHGVTGIRDVGGSLEAARLAEHELELGAALGPRIVASGPVLGGSPASNPLLAMQVATAEEAERAVARLFDEGAQLVAVGRDLPRRVYSSLVRAAHSRGLPVDGAAPETVGPGRAAEQGQRILDHPSDTAAAYCTDHVACEELFATSREAGTCHTPALMPLRVRARLDDPATHADPRLRWLPGTVRARWENERQRLREEGAEPGARAARLRSALWLAGALEIAGVPILAGSAAGDLYAIPGAALHAELDLLVRSGLSPTQALRAATLNPARCLGRADELGSIEVGKLADLVLLDADPLVDIRNASHIVAVVAGGRLLDRAALDALLMQAQRRSGDG